MKYEANWESLDKRPVPQWFQDAKFGIFIHWGLYSVPGYAKKGEYAEWYGWNMNDKESATWKFHEKNYGKDFQYADFVKDFKAELFDAEEWVNLFQRAGAKYMNLVSKHHDGYCMYPSEYAWNWNSADLLPHRDFCAELKAACDKTDVKFGVYHSVYEWFHPLYLKDPEQYALEHLIPMLKELIEKYQPATLFTDGEWAHPSDVWHSVEFLEWLYNESSVKDFIVPNDRWGKETRGVHGGNFTTEYGYVSNEITNSTAEDIQDVRYFEECRGIGKSFGVNRIETTDDYMSAAELIELLVDLVSAGGNLLLNVGPNADGTIPVIMQERLEQMGDWLKVNGEGIYASRKLKKSKCEKVWYTQKDGKIYVFFAGFPFGEKTVDLDFDAAYKAHLLGCDAKVELAAAEGGMKLIFPAINPDDMKSDYIYTVCLEK